MKLRFAALVGALVLVCAPFVSAADTYKVDAEKSKVDFVGKKSDGQHKGGFKKVTGEALVDLENPDNGKLTLEIDAASLWSDDSKLTDHLKNPDFFNVRKFPKITFESTKVEHTAEGEVTITGKLTMLDKTVETKVPVKAELNDGSIALNAKFKIDRSKWGMKYGEGKINNDVELEAVILLKK